MLKITIACLLLSVIKCQELHLCKKAVTGQACEMMCHTPPEGNKEIKITRNTQDIVVCDNSTTCVVKSTEYTDATVHWMDHGDMAMVHFTIAKLKIERDVNEWSCSYGKNVSEKQSLKVFSMPSSCQLVKVPANDKMNASLQCQVNCTYPTAAVNVKLFANGVESSETAKKTEVGGTDCTSTMEKNLAYTWMVQPMEDTEYKCDCSVTAIDWKDSGSIGMATKSEDGMAITTIVAIVIVVVVVIIAVAIAIFLIKKRRNSKGVQLSKEAEGEREEL